VPKVSKVGRKKKKWDSFASNSVKSFKKQHKEKLGAHRQNEPWQKGLPHYGGSGKGGK
jgi:hypothetical protein